MTAIADLTIANVSRKQLVEGVGLSSEDVSTLFKYRTKVPCLSDEHPEVEGFVVDAHQMWVQLGLDTEAQEFRNWVRSHLLNPVVKAPKKRQKTLKGLTGENPPKVFQNGRDYEVILVPSEGGRPWKNYRLTLDCAKQLALAGNGAHCHLVRQYFIVLERAFFKLMVWQDKRLSAANGAKALAACVWDQCSTDEEARGAVIHLYHMISEAVIAKHGSDQVTTKPNGKTVARDSSNKEVNETIADTEGCVFNLLRAKMPIEMVEQTFRTIFNLI